MEARTYGTIGIVGVGGFALTLVALHILDPGLSVLEEYLSVYALGDYGWLNRVGDIAMGLGVIAVALGLRAALSPGKRVTASWVLILAAGLGFIVSGLFDTDPTGTTDPTTAGALHDLGGYVSMLGILVSVWMLRGVFARDDSYRHVASIQKRFAILMSAAFLALLAFEGAVGLTQRVFVVVVVSWLLALASALRRSAEMRPISGESAPTGRSMKP